VILGHKHPHGICNGWFEENFWHLGIGLIILFPFIGVTIGVVAVWITYR